MSKIEKIKRFAQNKDLATFEELADLGENLAKVAEAISNIPKPEIKLDGIEQLKGDRGEKGEKGDKGDPGEQGIPGENGLDGANGRDGRDGKDGIDGQDGKDGVDGKDGKDGKDGSPDTGEQIVQKVNELSTDDEELKIDASHIKNFPKEVKKHSHIISRNVAYFDETTLVVENPTRIKLTGSGVSAALDSEGALVITVTGTASREAYEQMTDSGDHTAFTISNTPNAGTLLVFNMSSQQTVIPTAYTNTGTSIKFNTSQQVDDGAGNLVTPVFYARYSY